MKKSLKLFGGILVIIGLIMCGYAVISLPKANATTTETDKAWVNVGVCQPLPQVDEAWQQPTCGTEFEGKQKQICVHQEEGTANCKLEDTRYVGCTGTYPACEPSVTPTPTATPEATPTPGNPGNGNVPSNPHTDTTEAPTCSNGDTVQLPANVFVTRDGSHATVNGFITQGDSANIYWKESSESTWTNSSAGTNPNGVFPNADHFVSYSINDLKVGVDYDFGFQQKDGCGGGEIVTAFVHDGANQKVVFRVTRYEFSK